MLTNTVGYSLYPIDRVLHGAYIRPYALCKELEIQLLFQDRTLTSALRLLKAVARNDTLLVFPTYTTHPYDMIFTYLAKLRGCRLALDVADIWYLQHHFFHGEESEKSVSDFAQLVNLSDVLFFSTRSLKRMGEEVMNLGDKEVYVVENASDPSHFRFTPLPLEKTIFFVGGYVHARGIDELLASFRLLRKRGIDCTLKLVSIGFPTNFHEEGIEVWRKLYYDQIPALFESAYAFVIPHRVDQYMRIAAPLKLFDAMASGRPIVTTKCDETMAVVSRENCGLVADADPESIANAVSYLFDNRSIAEEMGRRGRLAVEARYSWKVRAQQIHEILSRQ